MTFPEYELISQTNTRPRSAPAANLHSVEEGEASGEVADLYEHFRSHFGRPSVPGILKCFATHPPLLRHMMDMSESLIFTEGHLSRLHKEMIATLVSSQNACPYCADSHAYFLRVHGGSQEALSAIQKSELASSALTAPESALLSFVQKVNSDSDKINKADIDSLIGAGWSELQIAEAVHVGALFATFNRVANAFGLESQGLLNLLAPEAAASHTETPTDQRSAR